MWEKLYSKNGLAAKHIAKELLTIDEGNKIPRITDFSIKLNFGRGTIQSGLKLLESMNAIKIEGRGHLGTFLIKKDNKLLQEIAGISPLIGSMPLPYTRKYEGLATGLINAFESAGKKLYLTFMRGGMNRLETIIKKKSDMAIVSKLTAHKVLPYYPNLKIFKELGTGTYVSEHKIFLADRHENQIHDGMRVGVDLDSIDQRELTYTELSGKNVEFIKINYMQLIELLMKKQIDAAVWSTDEPRMRHFKVIDFQNPKAKQLSKMTSEAVIVIESNRIQEIAEKWEGVDTEIILKTQQEVEKGERIPSY